MATVFNKLLICVQKVALISFIGARNASVRSIAVKLL